MNVEGSGICVVNCIFVYIYFFCVNSVEHSFRAPLSQKGL